MTEPTFTPEELAEPAAPAVETVDVVLIADRHEHDGQRYVRGDTFAVPLALVAHLRAHGIAEPAA